MADRQIREGYTEFADTTNPWFQPFGRVGKFFSKFFSRGKYQELDAEYMEQPTGDPVAPGSTRKPSQPLHGDAISSRDVIKVSTVSHTKTNYPILPQVEYDRKKRYKEYEDMDGYPEIGSAFDIYADDCSQDNLDGSKWDVICDDEIAKQEVLDLFDEIKLDRILWDIVRNTVKYGDNFLELIVDLQNIKKGIQRVKILNPNFIFRVEDEFGYLVNFLQEIPKKKDWTTYGSVGGALEDTQVIPLDAGQIVHFRLHTSDPSHYPYGKSVASNARAIYKSLKMMEDAMLIYRLARAPERRIFYLDTGSLPAAKAEMHIKQQMDKFKKSKMFNRQTGNIEESFNALAADEDFFIAVNGKGSGTKIDTLKGAENLGEVDDVKYFRDKLLAALKVPKDYIVEKDQSPERKANLSQLDVKFSRVINRIQKSIEVGLETIAHRHLMIKGFPLSIINDLKVKLPAPSDMALKRQLDIDQQKAAVVGAVKSLQIFPLDYIYKQYYQFNDVKIKEIKDKFKEEQKEAAKEQLKQQQTMQTAMTPPPGAAGGAMGGGMGAAPPPPQPPQGPPMESEENTPPTQQESVDLNNLERLIVESGGSSDVLRVIRSLKYGE